MNFKKSIVIVVVLLIFSLVGCGKKQENVELLVSAAASLTDVLGEIATVYKTLEPETTLVFTFGGSGALQTQIEEGAPVDIFMSAAQKQMKALDEGGHIVDGTVKTLLVNKVVLIAPTDSTLNLTSFEDMGNDEVKKIAIGDPASVPVGQYSEEIFANLDLTHRVDKKLVLGSDVRTVLTWVESGEVDLGIVYATDAYTSDQIKIIAEAPDGSHKEVSYPVGVVEGSKNLDRAKAFLDFLSTEEAIKVFEKYGFSMK